jgi:hypothetical protein
MSYPKPVTLQSLTAARERLLTAKIDPAQPMWVENLAHAIIGGSAEPTDWSERQTAGPPCFLECTLGEMLAQFDDCPEFWTTLPKTDMDYGEGFTDLDGAVWMLSPDAK